MPSSPFLEPNGWEIQKWVTESPVAEGIPDRAFKVPGILLITLASSSPDSFNLQWQDQDGQQNFVSGLHPDPLFDPEALVLIGENLGVMFSGKPEPVFCHLKLTLDFTKEGSKLVTGKIQVAMEPLTKRGTGVLWPESGSGTFTATANPGSGPVDTGAASKRTPS